MITDKFGNKWDNESDITEFMDECFSEYGWKIMGEDSINILCDLLDKYVMSHPSVCGDRNFVVTKFKDMLNQ